MNSVFNLYFDLRRSQKRQTYAELLIACLLNGGFLHEPSNATYREEIRRYFFRNRREYFIVKFRPDVEELERAIA